MRVRYGDDSYFVKLNTASRADMFAAEALGLRELQGSHTLRVPEPVCWGDDGESAYLVLEDLQLGGHGDLAALGEGLAAMHRVTRERFGWDTDNTIGSTLQINTCEHDWVDFLANASLAVSAGAGCTERPWWASAITGREIAGRISGAVCRLLTGGVTVAR